MTSATRPRNLQLLVSSPDEERAALGLDLALAAAVSDVQVVVFFAMEAARFVCARHAREGRIADLIGQLRQLGCELYCCSACAHEHCEATGGETPLVEGVRRAGLAAVVLRASATHETIAI